MAKGNSIILSTPPKGVFKEGIISGTPKPGTVMQIDAGVAEVGGRLTYQVAAPGTDGKKVPICVLLEDTYQGFGPNVAYVSGTRGFLYFPLPGEELNMQVVHRGTGTGNSVAIGDNFEVQTGTGLLVESYGAPADVPFSAIETIADPPGIGAASSLVACVRN